MIRTNPRDKLRKKDDKIRYIFINEWLDFVLTCSLCKGPRAKFNSIKINLKVNMILVFFKLNIKEERLRKEIFFFLFVRCLKISVRLKFKRIFFNLLI